MTLEVTDRSPSRIDEVAPAPETSAQPELPELELISGVNLPSIDLEELEENGGISSLDFSAEPGPVPDIVLSAPPISGGLSLTLTGTDTAIEPEAILTPQEQAFRRMQEAISSPDYLEIHGPHHGVYRSETTFLDPRYQQVHAEPSLGFMASNYKPGRDGSELYYVNGMTVGPRDMDADLGYLTRVYGRPVTAIINGQEPHLIDDGRPGMLRSILHGICGLFSPAAGHGAEPKAIDNIERSILHHVENGTRVHIIAHSQGSILVGNALDRLLGSGSKLSEEQKDKVRELVEVTTFGAAQHYFASGVQVQEYAHRGDFVVGITNIATVAREAVVDLYDTAVSIVGKGWRAFKRLCGYEAPEPAPPDRHERAPVVYLNGGHGFKDYLQQMPTYFVERFLRNDGDLDSVGLAKALKRSIIKGELSDPVHGKIIGNMVERGDREFARTFLSGSMSGQIDNYRIPDFEALKSLAELTPNETRLAG